jgi:hypothetical protein
MARMIDLGYSLIIEATREPDFFGFYSPDLEGYLQESAIPLKIVSIKQSGE